MEIRHDDTEFEQRPADVENGMQLHVINSAVCSARRRPIRASFRAERTFEIGLRNKPTHTQQFQGLMKVKKKRCCVVRDVLFSTLRDVIFQPEF